jgi:hypothetical protein
MNNRWASRHNCRGDERRMVGDAGWQDDRRDRRRCRRRRQSGAAQLSAVLLACALAPLLIASCGGAANASPEHIGTWQGSTGAIDVKIVVAGEPGHYTADYDSTSPDLGTLPTIHFSGGYADAAGNVTFRKDSVINWALTLGPVTGDSMTAYVLEHGFAVEMTRY